jgi:hypothetical protein
MNTIRTSSMCVVLIAGFALLAVPVQPGVHSLCVKAANQYSPLPKLVLET